MAVSGVHIRQRALPDISGADARPFLNGSFLKSAGPFAIVQARQGYQPFHFHRGQMEGFPKRYQSLLGGARCSRLPAGHGAVAVPFAVLAVDLRHSAQQLFLGKSFAAVRVRERLTVGPHQHPHLCGS